jgi:phosphoglycolate phosphatase
MYLVLFDCDGTLVDSQAIIVAAMEGAFRSNGLAPPDRAAILSIVGLSLPVAVATLVADRPEVSAPAVVAAYKEGFHRLRTDPAHREPLYPGARAAIDAIAARPDVLLGVATGKSRRGLDAVLGHHRLADRFVTLQTADDAPSKPDPTMVRRALLETGVEAERTVVVGDTAFDVEMALAAGAHAIGVAWGYHPVERLVSAGAERIVDGFAALPAAIGTVLGHLSETAP